MRDEQGFALVTVLMVVTVLMILGTSIMYVQALEMKQTLRQEQLVQAHYLARSGIEVGLRYLEVEVAAVTDLKDLKMDSLEYAFPDMGSYRVVFAVDPAAKVVDLSATGVVNGRVEVAEKIKLTVGLTNRGAGIVYASDIPWYVDNKKQKGNVAQQLKKSSASTPLASDRPVVLTQADKISTIGTHYLKAPAMQFVPTKKWIEMGNGHKLALISDFIRFDADVSMHKAELILNVIDGVDIQDSKKYGIVYFGGTVYRNDMGDRPSGITKGKYYLFQDGTVVKNDGNSKWTITGELQELSPDDPRLVNAFDFSRAEGEGKGFVPVVSRYSSGN